jgi:hypothetical protein
MMQKMSLRSFAKADACSLKIPLHSIKDDFDWRQLPVV